VCPVDHTNATSQPKSMTQQSSSSPSNPLNILGTWSLTNPRHCLDLRSSEDYATAHLIPSTSIPLSTLEQRFSQLPPRTSHTSFLLLTEPNAQFNDIPVSALLRSRGWNLTGVIELPVHADQFWNHARDLNVLGTGSQGAELLFLPSPIVGAWSTWIEDSLLRIGRDEARVLDIGCGSGRDLGFLANRQFPWKITGVDNWKKALERAEVMVTSINSGRLENLVHAEVNEDSGEIIPCTPDCNRRLPRHIFDLVIIIRFFPKELFSSIHRYVREGGYLLFSHFTDPLPGRSYENPPPNKRVRPVEVEELLLESSRDWKILQAEYSECEDGRRLWDVVARYR